MWQPCLTSSTDEDSGQGRAKSVLETVNNLQIRMKIRYILLILAVCFCAMGAKAQITVVQKMDTNQIYIGEQVLLKIKVTASANDLVVMPRLAKTNITEGVEVLPQYTEKEEGLDGGRRKAITEAYRITSFDSALYRIPPIEVEVNHQAYKSAEGIGFKVISPEVDTVNVNKFMAPKENIDVVYEWEDLRTPFMLWALGLVLILVAIYMAVQIRNNHRLLPRIRLFPETPPHKWALKQINILNTRKPAAPEDAHLYYSELTDIIRLYIARRYGFKATAMTSEQIIERLSEINDPRLLGDLREMFSAADMVKYAGMSSAISENDRNLLIAMEYINSTKDVQQENQKPRVVEQEPKAKRTRNTHHLLVALTIVVGVAGAALLVWAVAIMYNLYF